MKNIIMRPTLRTLFFALGIAMIWLGLFYNIEWRKQQESAEVQTPRVPVEGFDTYTLENDRYEGEYSPQVEFRHLNVTDSSFEGEENPAVNQIQLAGFAEEFHLMEQERSLNKLSAVLAFAGAVFFLIGYASLKREK